MIGQTISHYKILERLGQGGMGVVYKALDTTLGRTVALKFISPSAGADASMKQRLIREAKACASLNHPNITTVYELVQVENHEFIVIEFIEGKTLQEILEEKRFEIMEVLPIALQLLDGLEAAHGKGIVHRDLKASNIMLDLLGRVKIMDFGLAKLAQGSMLTELGATVGTAAYMSPEQARGEETDHRSDIYSVGVVLYQLLTGQLPFLYAHHLAVLYAVVNEDPRPPRDLNSTIPAPLEKIVLTAMAKKPAERFQSCAEMARSLVELSDDLGGRISLRKRFRHVFERGDAVPAGAKSVEHLSLLSRALVLKYVVPVVIAVLAAGYGIVRMLPSRQAGEPEERRLAKAHVERALSFMESNNPELASRELELAIENDSSYAVAWTNLAFLNVQAKRLDLAVKQARKAVALDRTNSSALYNLAYALEEIGKDDEAVLLYAEAIEKDSSFTEAYSALGSLYIKMNRTSEAVQLLLKGEQMNPSSPYRFLLYKNLGKAYVALREYGRAREFLERSLELRADWPETLFLLASAYEALSMTKESLAKWQQYASIERDPAKLAEARRHLEYLKKKPH